MKQYIATSTDPPFGRKGKRNHYFTATQKSNVYDAIDASGNDGMTRHQIASKVGLAADRISFYLSDLRRGGYIAVKGDPTVVSATMNADEAAFAAMLGLENALVARVKEDGFSPDKDRAFVKYSLIKQRALAQPSPTSSASQVQAQKNEARVALGTALVALVKIVYLS